jgi:hypothetical protein
VRDPALFDVARRAGRGCVIVLGRRSCRHFACRARFSSHFSSAERGRSRAQNELVPVAKLALVLLQSTMARKDLSSARAAAVSLWRACRMIPLECFIKEYFFINIL